MKSIKTASVRCFSTLKTNKVSTILCVLCATLLCCLIKENKSKSMLKQQLENRNRELTSLRTGLEARELAVTREIETRDAETAAFQHLYENTRDHLSSAKARMRELERNLERATGRQRELIGAANIGCIEEIVDALFPDKGLDSKCTTQETTYLYFQLRLAKSRLRSAFFALADLKNPLRVNVPQDAINGSADEAMMASARASQIAQQLLVAISQMQRPLQIQAPKPEEKPTIEQLSSPSFIRSLFPTALKSQLVKIHPSGALVILRSLTQNLSRDRAFALLTTLNTQWGEMSTTHLLIEPTIQDARTTNQKSKMEVIQ